jgi:hypothetical protein
MIEIAERITRMTTAEHLPAGVRVTLEFNRSAALSPGQEVRWRYDSGDGPLLECIGIPHPTHVVARRGHLVVYHYRLSHWIASTARLPKRVTEAPAVDQSRA